MRKCVNNLADNNYGKTLMFLDNLFFEQLKYRCDIKAVVIPNITNKEITEIIPISPSKSLLMLAPNSIFFLIKCWQGFFSALSWGLKHNRITILQIIK